MIIVEPQLSAKPRKIEGVEDYLVENRANLERNSDYSFFLKQFKLDVESGSLDSFLAGIEIENAKEFFEISEFALIGDKEVFLQVRPFGLYYMEEELSGGCHQFPKEFERERILELISNVKYSETMIENCLKMLHYLPKLIVN